MQTVTTIGLDIAKSVFQVHGVDAAGQVVTSVAIDPDRTFAALADGSPQQVQRIFSSCPEQQYF